MWKALKDAADGWLRREELRDEMLLHRGHQLIGTCGYMGCQVEAAAGRSW